MISDESFRIIFMGTPDFAVESLRQLIEQGYNVVGVVTNPDKPAGRGQKLKESPVKAFARQRGLRLLQPNHLDDPSFARELEELNPSLQVVVAFKILPPRIFTIPHYGTFNLHASLLPDYRGAAPINHAIMQGESQTGVTTFFLDPKVDTGKVIKWKKTPIEPHDSAGSLHDRLMELGGELVVETVEAIRTGNYQAIDQNELAASHAPPKKAPKIHKADCQINWNQSTQVIYNFIRGLSPYPAAWTRLSNSETFPLKVYHGLPEYKTHDYPAGSLHSDHKSYLKVAAWDGFIHLKEIQQAGKKKMATEEFLKGFREITAYHCQ